MKRYSLILTGEILPSARRHEAVAALAELLRLSLPQADAALNGKPRPLKGLLSQERAREAQSRFEQAGIGCELREEAAQSVAPKPAADVFKSPPQLDVAPVTMRCPKCDFEQPPGDRCVNCGIVYAKLEQMERRATQARAEAAAIPKQDRFPYRLVNQLLLLVFLSSVGLAIWSHWQKDQLPPPSLYDLTELQAPRQEPTDAEPFQIEANDVIYTIEPLFDYELDGVVVSLHDSDAFWDIYHFKDWKDFINIRDLCVVWGDNVAMGVFRDMQYKNTTWTCWISTNDPVAYKGFAWDQLSNNHMLSHDEYIQKAIKSAEIGDQIRFRGKLARYSHAGGFQRGTSTTRTDSGNGACETIYIEDFQITRKSNTGWRLTYRLSSALAVLAFIGLAVIFFVAPYRHRE
ncbi:hypothetical protein G3480_19315 [Thiorhodococcus mannitoliphagus]|uniref:Uncharacterized protein n=1 Tax=Thiorhodococcus mannitoliphagus TaxID=329406 RepID=A0A6P1DXK7_9GAMM|nr:hypothetical protein [Thiorhodococcus mannitoliphagus]NEX22429.1 hypothetical protein [Thiorhodococcus mannitoliphagus]